MRKKKIICGGLVLALTLPVLASCGKPKADAYWKDSDRQIAAAADESGQPDAVIAAPLPSGQEPVISADAMLAAYTQVLEDFYYNHKDHTGQDLGYFENAGEDWNQFAVYDVDMDGQNELLVRYTASQISAGQREYVLKYDEASGTITEELTEFPPVIYYDNGVIEAGWSHNHGRAGDALWPYTFWRYDPQTDTYQAGQMADAWEKELVEYKFPDSADKDGDGVVYYIIEYGNPVDYSTDTPIDKSGYDEWREGILGGAEKLEIPFMPLTETNIKNIQ